MVEDLLESVRAEGASVEQIHLGPPWSISFEDGAPLRLLTMARGDAWILPADGQPVRLAAGDVALVRGPRPYVVADSPDSRPALVARDDECRGPDGTPVDGMVIGVRTCGYPADGPDLLVDGTYWVAGAVGQRLLDGLPTVVHLAAARTRTSLTELLLTEIAVDEPGQRVVLDRLVDLLVVATLRAWLTGPDAGHPAWHRALADPVVGPAMRLMHDDPAYPWTVAVLADKVDLSRAAFARRFRDAVGEGPMSYLAGWRTCLAADELRLTDDTVAAIARRVGYTSAFTLSVAFKRHYGVNPTEYRRPTGVRQIT
ncbi:AraC family transcriptional regulator [Fodinicola acaciae]|uniref:AraC family transcriptional regulator n=1 Tax=Fodinicola acaciae TaxID=2681555 RepID=UPI001C9E3E99|nr:AraC family transcriptional regulator [Fodinicola acaciae]